MSRLSEKTIEINYCSQLSGVFGGQLLFFGLTQLQEARMGFDAMTSVGGVMLLL